MSTGALVADHPIDYRADAQVIPICLVDLVASYLCSIATTNKSVNAVPDNTATIPFLFHATNPTISLSHGELFSRLLTVQSMFIFAPKFYQCARIV